MRNQRKVSAPVVAVSILLAGAWGTAIAENIDPADDGHQFGWGENVGWFNAEPQGNGGPGVEVGDFGLIGWLWGENIGWVSLSCFNTMSCFLSDYGVGNNGFGLLSGFAWSENAGWLNFSPTACLPDPTCGVRVDPLTGYFSGRAWGENIGWVTLASAGPTADSVRTSWCAGTAAAPGTGPALSVMASGPDVVLSWSGLASSSWYDVVQGDVAALRATGGDFGAATQECIASRTTGTSQNVSGAPLSPGEAQWFLIRGANCRGHGTYDSGSGTQSGARDAEIAASMAGCP